MTSDDGNRMTPATESDSTRFRSFDALRTEHEALLSSAQSKEAALGSVPTATIRDFLSRAAATGGVIIDPHERRSAQNMLRFWAAELITRGITDWALPSLAAPQLGPIRAETASAAKSNVSDQDLARSRALVRIAASARQWLESRDSGWLLKGEALREAEEFVKEDDDIRALVAASRAAHASVIRTAVVTTVIVLAVLVSLVYAVQGLAEWAQDRVARPAKPLNQTWALYLFGKFRPILPPPNFSRPALRGIIEKVHLPGLNLYAPNFSRLTLRNDVQLDGARLSGAAFTQSTISGSSFKGAQLSSAQFREGSISSTSFAQAKLDWVVFDRAVFTNVDFSGANLSSTSFWSASFDDKFETRFKDTPWWFAQGWNSCHIKALVRNAPAPSVLKQTEAFRDDIDDPKRRLAAAAPGSPERMGALNDLAWALATWGVDLQSRDAASAKDDATCLTARDMPDNATDAAKQAVCMGEKLAERSASAAPKMAPRDLANLWDTYGYVLLQTGQIQAAVTTLDRAAQVREKDGDVLFHAAIAHYAAHDDEKASALLTKATEQADFPRPTHELWTLRAYLNAPILDWNDKLWPVPATTTPCRPPG
jgi:tetratricopeptide (TPR) repeat protein